MCDIVFSWFTVVLTSKIRPSPSAAPFVAIIVKVPVVQVATLILASIILCLELPLPALKKLAIYRSLVLRVVLILFQAFLTILFYQVCTYSCRHSARELTFI